MVYFPKCLSFSTNQNYAPFVAVCWFLLYLKFADERNLLLVVHTHTHTLSLSTVNIVC